MIAFFQNLFLAQKNCTWHVIMTHDMWHIGGGEHCLKISGPLNFFWSLLFTIFFGSVPKPNFGPHPPKKNMYKIKKIIMVSVLLSALVERFRVSRMRNFNSNVVISRIAVRSRVIIWDQKQWHRPPGGGPLEVQSKATFYIMKIWPVFRPPKGPCGGFETVSNGMYGLDSLCRFYKYPSFWPFSN